MNIEQATEAALQRIRDAGGRVATLGKLSALHDVAHISEIAIKHGMLVKPLCYEDAIGWSIRNDLKQQLTSEVSNDDNCRCHTAASTAEQLSASTLQVQQHAKEKAPLSIAAHTHQTIIEALRLVSLDSDPKGTQRTKEYKQLCSVGTTTLKKAFEQMRIPYDPSHITKLQVQLDDYYRTRTCAQPIPW
jgi:hypothetical protein